MAKQPEAQDIEALKRRHQDLATRRTRAETQLETAQQELARLKAEAKSAYGTDDLAELEKLLAARKAANEKKRAEYQASLERIERELAEVEAKFEGRPGGAA
jgi:chromosome segregation ATPase